MIEYSYSVEQQEYQGSRYCFHCDMSFKQAYRIVKRHPVRKTFPIHYDPSHPSRSVIKPGAPSALYFHPLGGLLVLTLGFGMLLGGLYMARGGKQEAS